MNGVGIEWCIGSKFGDTTVMLSVQCVAKKHEFIGNFIHEFE